MNRTIAWAVMWACGAMMTVAAGAQEMPAAVVAENPDSVSIAERRSEGIMQSLNIDDADKAARVRRHIENFIVTLKNLHEGANPPKGDAKRDALAEARDALYAGLDAEQLDEQQRLTIKNGLSANHYRINYDAFQNLVPTLTDEEKAHIHSELAAVFDEAIVLNSGTAKGEAFHRARGRINNYLSQRGYDLKALSVERNARLRRGNAPATQPAD